MLNGHKDQIFWHIHAKIQVAARYTSNVVAEYIPETNVPNWAYSTCLTDIYEDLCAYLYHI